MKRISCLLGLVWMTVCAQAYNWELYDDFSGGFLDSKKWSMDVERSSAYPSIEDGQVNVDATLYDGTCKIVMADADLAGVKADLLLGYADSDSGNEISIDFSNGAELWLDVGMYGTIHYISASGELESGTEIMGNYVSNAVYDQVYELAVVVTNGTVKCYVDDVLLDQYEGGAGLSITRCSIGAWSDDATGTSVEGTIDNVYVLREAWDISGIIKSIDISAGYELLTSEYMVDLELEIANQFDGEIASVQVSAPFGTFSCEQDWEDWEYENVYSLDSIPEVNGDWTVALTHTNGSIGTTVISFMQTNGVALPDVFSCPELTYPDLSGSDPIFAVDNLTFQWDSDFDPHANLVALGAWNELMDEDLELMFAPDPSVHSIGSLTLYAGITEAWFADAFYVGGTNAAGIAYEFFKYASYDYDLTVVDREWDADQDHISNEWELEYFGSMTACDPDGDADGDGVNNLSEYQAGTDPTNVNSLFAISGHISDDEFTLNWPAIEGIEYNVLWSTNLLEGFSVMASGLSFPQHSYTGMIQEVFPVAFCAVRAERVSTNSSVVRRLNVDLDGDASDWAGVEPQFTDPDGDSSVYSGLDITSITIAKGETNLFLKVDRVGSTLATDASCQIWVYLRSEVDGVSDYGISYSRDDRYGHTSVALYDVSGDWYQISASADGSISYDDSSASMEISIPLSDLNLVDHYALDCYTFHTSDWSWQENGENEENNDKAVVIFP